MYDYLMKGRSCVSSLIEHYHLDEKQLELQYKRLLSNYRA